MKRKNVSIIMLFTLMIVLTGSNLAAASITFKVPANPVWSDTGVKLTNGQTVSITANGTWDSGEGACDPSGDKSTGYYDLFLNHTSPSKHGELIAFVGSNGTDPYRGNWGNGSFFPQPTGAEYWAIGNNTTFNADRDGELWLGINDDAVTKNVGDNTGFLTAIIVTSVLPTSILPVADFTCNVTKGYIPLSVQFTDRSKYVTMWKWDFGDGVTSSEQDPVHTYSEPGNYHISLTVSNDAGSNTSQNSTICASTKGQNQTIPQENKTETDPKSTTETQVQTSIEAFRVGPTVSLRPLDSEINKSQEGIVEFFLNNPSLNDCTLEVDLAVDVPSDIYIYSQDGGISGGAGTVTGHFTVPPGSSRTTALHIKGGKGGTFPVHFSGIYWPGNNKDKWDSITLDSSFNVLEGTPTLTPTPTSVPVPKPAPGLGVASLIFIFLMVFCLRRK